MTRGDGAYVALIMSIHGALDIAAILPDDEAKREITMGLMLAFRTAREKASPEALELAHSIEAAEVERRP